MFHLNFLSQQAYNSQKHEILEKLLQAQLTLDFQPLEQKMLAKSRNNFLKLSHKSFGNICQTIYKCFKLWGLYVIIYYITDNAFVTLGIAAGHSLPSGLCSYLHLITRYKPDTIPSLGFILSQFVSHYFYSRVHPIYFLTYPTF